nr:reverse transcriptase domain-containing protein [Tanacetum cinerariifolium]
MTLTGVAEDVFVKVGKFHFPTDFVVVDFEAGPWVPLILGRSFLRIGRALIDVYGEEITLWVNDESEFVQDVLDFKYNSKSGNPTLVSNPSFCKETKSEFCKEPIVKFSSPTLTPFGESDFLMEEVEDFLKDESIPMGIEDSCYDPDGDILYLEKLLNDDPSQLPSMDLKQAEKTKAKSLIEEPSKLELKELPKLNDATRKDHFPLPFMDQMLERLAGNEFYCFLDGFSGYFQIPIFLRKLKTRWSGPFTITQVFSYGTVELSQPDGPNFKVNGHRVKHYFGGDIPSKVVPDLHTILMDK